MKVAVGVPVIVPVADAIVSPRGVSATLGLYV
jgi:hypothetical protein